MLILVKLLAPVIAGGVAGAAVMFGIVYSQTQVPEANPADQQVLTYGG